MHERPLQLLLLGEDPAEVDLVRRALSLGFGHVELVHRCTLAETITIASHGAFDCALVNLEQRDSVGPDPVALLSDYAPDLPLVVLTHRADRRVHASLVGAPEVVAKPELTPTVLRAAIETSIEHRKLVARIEGSNRRVQEQESATREILDMLDDAIVIVDERGLVRMANLAAQRLFGEFENRHLDLPESSDDFEVRRMDGAFRRVRIRSRTVTWLGQPSCMFSVKDVTEQLRAGDLARRLAQSDRMRALGRLAGGIAHEINNPAALLATNLEFLRHTLTNPDREPLPAATLESLVDDCRNAIARIGTIATDLHACSHVADDEIELVDLNDVVETASLVVFPTHRRPGVVLDLHPVPSIAGHRGKLIQAVSAVLANVLPYAEARGRVVVSTLAGRDEVRLVIADTRLGLEFRDQVFEPFFHVSPSGDRPNLALALAHEIIRVHRGEIRVQSESGGGSRFEVRIPVEDGLMLPRPRPIVRPNLAAQRKRLLLIDDEVAFLRALARLLQLHYDVETAPGGAEALRCNPSSFDIIVCDLMMPGMDGPSFYQQLRRTDPEAAARVVFTTGGAFTEDVGRFLELVPNTILQKPFSSSELRAAVERVLALDPRRDDKPRVAS